MSTLELNSTDHLRASMDTADSAAKAAAVEAERASFAWHHSALTAIGTADALAALEILERTHVRSMAFAMR